MKSVANELQGNPEEEKSLNHACLKIVKGLRVTIYFTSFPLAFLLPTHQLSGSL